MWFRPIRMALAGCLGIALIGGTALAQTGSGLAEAQAKLDQLSAWLATSDQAQGWNQFLATDQLRAELNAGMKANPATVAQILSRYRSNTPGLDRRRFVEMRQALENWLSDLQPATFDQIFAAIDAAKGAYVPLTQADVQEAHQKLAEAVSQLDRWLKNWGETGAGWRSYLKLDQLQQELAKPSPDLAVLDAVYARFDSGQSGLNWRKYTEVRDALRQYVGTVRAVGNQKLAQQYPLALDALAKSLRAYRDNPNPQDAQRLSKVLHGLQELRQAGWLVGAVHRQYGMPNIYVEASPAMVGALIGRPVDEVQPVVDCILGTSIHGTGHTTGNVTVELVPSGQYAAIDMLMFATTSSNTIGLNGPVRVYTTGLTQHASRKRLILSPDGLSSEPAATNAVTNSDINSIDANRPIVERIAWRRAAKTQPEANQIASQHAEQRVNARMDEQVEQMIADMNQRYQKQVLAPLSRIGLFPSTLGFSTTPSALNAVALEAPNSDLGAATVPPAPTAGADLSLRVHESAINNAAQRLLGGMVVQDKQFQKDVADMLGRLPEQLKNPEQDGGPSAITFAKDQPISVAFGKDSFTVTIRGAAYAKGQTDYPGMNVTATYDLKQTEQGPRAVRRGGLEIFPPGFNAEKGSQLSTREQVIRRMLERRFDKVFAQEITPKPITPKGQLANVGTLVLKQWRSENGWMLLGWQRTAAAAQGVAMSSPAQP